MVTVANCLNIAEVQRLRIALDANGIESFVPDENVAVAAPYMFATKSGVRLQVAEEDEVQALAVIGEAQRDAAEPDRDQGGDES